MSLSKNKWKVTGHYGDGVLLEVILPGVTQIKGPAGEFKILSISRTQFPLFWIQRVSQEDNQSQFNAKDISVQSEVTVLLYKIEKKAKKPFSLNLISQNLLWILTTMNYVSDLMCSSCIGIFCCIILQKNKGTGGFVLFICLENIDFSISRKRATELVLLVFIDFPWLPNKLGPWNASFGRGV